MGTTSKSSGAMALVKLFLLADCLDVNLDILSNSSSTTLVEKNDTQYDYGFSSKPTMSVENFCGILQNF